jgi:paraquat-inducible protein B
MSDSIAEKSTDTHELPEPIIRKMRWPFPLIWLVPVLAAGLAGYYFYHSYQDRGPLITIKCDDASGIQPGQSHLMHLGVVVGEVIGTELTPDRQQALVHIRVNRSNEMFARRGAMFWIVRPEISTQEISGLSTVLSGPFVDCAPGIGEIETEFIARQTPPPAVEDGLRIVLKSPRIERLQADSPVFFRGIQVGTIQDTELSSDASSVEIQVFIANRYRPLVRANSQFWIVNGVDVKGGLLGGIEMKVQSVRSLLSGGISFATPQQKMGEPAKAGYEFVLHDQPNKDWLQWSPAIPIGPNNIGGGAGNTDLPHAPPAIRSAVGS